MKWQKWLSLIVALIILGSIGVGLMIGSRHQSRPVQGTELITFKNFVLRGSPKHSYLSHVDVKIYSKVNHQRVCLYSGQTTNRGALTAKFKRPAKTRYLDLEYTLGNKKRGYVVKANGVKYSINYRYHLGQTAVINGTHNCKLSKTIYSATKISNLYSKIYADQLEAVKLAQTAIPTLSNKLGFQPINIVWQRKFHLGQSNRFLKNGLTKNSHPIILIADRPDLSDRYLQINVAHEWAHWNMYRAVGQIGGSYKNHYTENIQPETSYKEGWALFQTNRYSYGFNWAEQNDILVQAEPKLFGRSTNYTVRGILYDLYDVNTVDESFNIIKSAQLNNRPLVQRSQLAEGIMYLAMVNSKAHTLAEYLQYIKIHFVHNTGDLQAFNKLLAVNGLTTTGQFTQ